MNEESFHQGEINQELGCKNCGAFLKFYPGTNHLICHYCGVDNIIEQVPHKIEELDFHSFLKFNNHVLEKQTIVSVQCHSCGAETSLDPYVISDNCPFCSASLVIKDAGQHELIKPKSVLPFKVKPDEANFLFKTWIKSIWFAPNGLKKYASITEKLKGMYIPYWTYDCGTTTAYEGERGIITIENYTTTENGRVVTKTRTRTDWYSVSGTIGVSFDDVLVKASKTLPDDYCNALEPWDLHALTPYNDKYLSGFRTESYQICLEEGFEIAKGKMEGTIHSAICRQIGGDLQKVHYKKTDYNAISFKHILLPIWLSSYKYKSKIYRFLINGRTGEVKGERPYSWIKIALAVILGIIVFATIYMMFEP